MSSSLKHYIRDIDDFPKTGVTFRDISPLLAERFSETITALISLHDDAFWQDVSAVAGIDARGFIFASAVADRLGKSLTLVRKSGKLPPPVVSEEYTLEYGSGVLEMKQGKGKLVIMDDVLATGGTLEAAANLAQKAGYDVCGLITVIDLAYLNDFSWNELQANSLVTYYE